jgi:hypothetical protein
VTTGGFLDVEGEVAGVTRSWGSEGRKSEKEGMSRRSRPPRLLLRLRMTAERSAAASREVLHRVEVVEEEAGMAGGAVAGPLSWFSTLLWSNVCTCQASGRCRGLKR